MKVERMFVSSHQPSKCKNKQTLTEIAKIAGFHNYTLSDVLRVSVLCDLTVVVGLSDYLNCGLHFLSVGARAAKNT